MLNKMPQPDIPGRARNLRAFYAFLWAWPGKKTLFMGSEFGQYAEWKYDQSLDWNLLEYLDHEGIRRVVRDLNKLYREDTALAASEQFPDGFQWLNVNDAANSVLTFLRRSGDGADVWVVACNFTPVVRDYRIGVPRAGQWEEVLNTDALEYGGTGEGNFGALTADAKTSWDNQPHSIQARLPGQSVVIFRQRISA
jgi:1,4-alpha-glucan branching enzyme